MAKITIVSNPTYSTGDIIEAVIVNNLRDDGLVLNVRTGGDPLAADKMLVSTGALAAAWSTALPNNFVTAAAIAADAVGTSEIAADAVGTSEIAPLAVTTAEMAVGAALANLGFTPVNKAGDTGVGTLSITGELYVVNTSGDAGVLMRLDGSSNVLYIVATPSASNGAGIALRTGTAGGAETDRLTITAAGAVDISTGPLSVVGNGVIHAGNIAAQGVSTAVTAGSATTAATATNALALQSVTWKTPLVDSPSAPLVLTTSFVAITGLTLSLDRVGTWLLFATAQFNWNPAGTDANALGDAEITVDGVQIAISPQVRFAPSGPDLGSTTFFGTATIAAQPKTALLRARKSGGSASATANSDSKLVAIWCAP